MSKKSKNKEEYFTTINIKNVEPLNDDEVLVNITNFAKGLKKEVRQETLKEVIKIIKNCDEITDYKTGLITEIKKEVDGVE